MLGCNNVPLLDVTSPHARTRASTLNCASSTNRTSTCRALVIVRTLALTNPGPPSSHAPSPNMHKSAAAALVPGMAMIFTMHFILELASDVNSSTKYHHCAACASYSSHRNSMWSLSFFFLHPLFRSLSDRMITSGSLLPTMCLISSRARLSVRHVKRSR